jgi:hypothetical protein
VGEVQAAHMDSLGSEFQAERVGAEQFVREDARVVDHDGGVAGLAGRGLDRGVARHIEGHGHYPPFVPITRRPS